MTTTTIGAAPKCQRNSKDGKGPSLVKELETAKILHELSRRSADDKIPYDKQCIKNGLLVSPTPSCEGTYIKSKKRRICEVGITRHGFHVPSSISYNQGVIGSTSQTFESPSPICSDDDDFSSSTIMTEIQESNSESSTLSLKDVGSLSLGNVSVKPLMPPPQMRHFNNFLNPGTPLRKGESLIDHAGFAPTPIKIPHSSEATKTSNQLIIGSPLMLMNIILNNDKHLNRNEIPICLPAVTRTQWPLPCTQTTDQASSSSIHIFPKLLNPQHIISPSSVPLTDSNISPTKTKKRKVCRMDTCDSLAAKRTPYCARHAGQRKCEFTECSKFAQGKTRFCIAHGGGRRCLISNCTRGARDQKYCAAHGGGRRCKFLKCTKLAVGGGYTCTAHGGGKRCQIADCSKSAQSSSNYCVRHGGGRKCNFGGCDKVARGKTGMCMSHANQSVPSIV